MSSGHPIIVIGMHRSGTSLITRSLERVGLFVGKKKDPNNEALFFLRLNTWLLDQAGARWDHPEPIRDLLEDRPTRSLAVKYIRGWLTSPMVASFLGWGRYLRHRSPMNLSERWGWKDPRNTYTLPIWLDLFPGARVVHVYRHGVDVARSLKERAEREPLSVPLASWRFSETDLHGRNSLRCRSLEGGFSLWEEYMREARRHVERLGDRAMELRFEHFVSEPKPALSGLAEFCDLPTTASRLEAVVSQVQRGRARAYVDDPDLLSFANTVEDGLRKWGY